MLNKWGHVIHNDKTGVTLVLSLTCLNLELSLCKSHLQYCNFSKSCMSVFMLEQTGMDKNHCALCRSDIPFSLFIPPVVYTLLINVCSYIRLVAWPVQSCYFASPCGNLRIISNRYPDGLLPAFAFAADMCMQI